MEKLLPQNVEAECGVLGSIIIDPEAIVQVADFLRAEDFYRDAHRIIFEVIVQLYEQHEPADFITICDELERRNKIDEVGGADYITSLVNLVPTSANVEHYGRIVARTAILRRLIHAAGQIAAVAYEEGDAEIALDKAEQLIFEISQGHTRSDFSAIQDVLSSYVIKLEQLHDRRGTIVGVPTGFTDLDRLTGGLQRSDLIILAARPAVGKTSFALSLARNAAVHYQNSVAVFSLEMSKEQLVQRFLSMQAGVDQQRLRTGWIEDEDWTNIEEAMSQLSQAKIYIDDTAGISTMEMRSKTRRLASEQGLDLIIVDYLQLMQSDIGGKRNENRVQEVSEISRNLKGLARELDVPVLALAQLSRTVESRQSKVPQLSDLRESGCLTGDTLVYLPQEGIYKRIDELVGKTGFQVLALNPHTWKLEPQVVTNSFSTGRKRVYKMTTRLGRTIRATRNHKFLTVHGWKRLDKLTPGTHIAVPHTLQGPTEATMTDAELALLGHLSGKFETNLFLEHIGGLGVNKAQHHAAMLEHIATRVAKPNRDVIPHGVWEHLGVTPRTRVKTGTATLLASKAISKTQYLRNLSRERALQMATLLEIEELSHIAQSDVYWDKIISIEEEGEEEVFDLTVELHHNFIGNNIIVHNSIEQDADIVMFIYRDEVYNPDTERKNIADIIVAKHRNGPVGEVSLFFQASQTRFADLEVDVSSSAEE